MTARPVHVYVLDDHAILREGIRSVLTRAGGFQVVGEASTAARGLRGILASRPDVALIDVRLPEGNGVQVVREVLSRTSTTRCILFTAFTDDEALYQAIMAGAAGYLTKDIPENELITAMRKVARGQSLLDRDMLNNLQRRSDPLETEGVLRDLTPQERRILKLVAEGLTNKEIAARLHLADKTVRNYVSTILSKLDMKNRTQVAAYVARLATKRPHEAIRSHGPHSPGAEHA